MYHNDGDKKTCDDIFFCNSNTFCFGQHKVVTMSDTEVLGYVLTFI